RSFRNRSAFPLLPPRFAPSSFASRGPIERAQRRELLADAQLESPVDRNVEALRLDAVGEIALTGRVAAGFVVRVAVRAAMAEWLQQGGRRVAQVHRHRRRAVLGDEGARPLPGDVDRVRLRRTGEIDARLRERELAFRR